jgi:hypothetical protein
MMQVRAWENQEEECNISLFRIVSRIRDYSGIKPPDDIIKGHKYSIFPSVNEFIVEYNFPLGVK